MKEILAALIGIIGIFITGMFGIHQYNRQIWSNNVSNERMKWLVSFREEVGLIMKALKCIDENAFKMKCNNESNKSTCKELSKIILDGEEARFKLISRINTNKIDGNEYNFAYKRILLDIKFDGTDKINYESFMELTNLILEEEWQKVKKEAKGEFYEK